MAASGGIVPNQLYVTYRQTGRTAQSIDSTAGSTRSFDLNPKAGVSHRAITLPAGVDAPTVAARLRTTAGVIDVAPVHTRTPLQVVNVNDPAFNNYDQWYLFKTNATPGGWSYAPDGTGIDIAIIDTGVDETNTDLSSKIHYQESVLLGVVSTSTSAIQDTNGHGTNTAGLAAAATDNAYGFASTGYNAGLQIYNIFPPATATSDCQTAATTDEAMAINDAVSHGASVISMSLGAPPDGGANLDLAEEAAVEAAITAGVTVVAAGGNEYANGQGPSPDYPAAYPGVIAVGASSAIDNGTGTYVGIASEAVASYSNSGVTLVAPGGDPTNPTNSDNDFLHWVEGYSTTTAAYPGDQCTNGVYLGDTMCRALFAGTSQATPQVSGTIALMMAYHGGGIRSLSPATVTTLLTSTADNIGQPSARQGAGRLNVGNAVAAAHP
jgi:subtilisin family serine protease